MQLMSAAKIILTATYLLHILRAENRAMPSGIIKHPWRKSWQKRKWIAEHVEEEEVEEGVRTMRRREKGRRQWTMGTTKRIMMGWVDKKMEGDGYEDGGGKRKKILKKCNNKNLEIEESRMPLKIA